MHWFDNFAKSLSRPYESRRVALGKMAAIIAAANASWPSRAGAAPSQTLHPSETIGGSPPPTGSPTLHTIGASASRRGIQVRTLHLPTAYKTGPCEFSLSGRNADFYYRATGSAGSQSLTLVVYHRTTISGTGRQLSAQVTDTIEVTSGGASVVKVESERNAVRGGSQSGTMRFEYGPAVQGISGAMLTFQGSSVHGTVQTGSSTLVHNATTLRTLHAQFTSDATPVAVSVDHTLYDGIQSLMQRFASERRSCSSTPPRVGGVSRDVASRARFFRSLAQPAIIADENRAPATYGGAAGVENQNESGAPSTPNCNSCMNAAANQATGCWTTLGADLLWGCVPCITAAISCQAEAVAAALGCWIPGAGCMQTVCGPANGCDTGDTCCGSKCCTGSAVCVGQPSTCCPPGYTIACMGATSGFPFCCANGDVCCGNDICCSQGSHCCGNFCCPQDSACCGVSCCSPGSVCANASQSLCCPSGSSICGSTCCPPGAICRNGVCCPGTFCGDQCCVNGELCHQATGQCYYPSFGTPSPRPSASKISLCLHGYSVCHSAYRNGSTKDVCCTAGLACCAGTCCGPGQQCGGNGTEFACGNWIH